MLDPTYVAACFRWPRTPARLSSGRCPACSPAGPGSPPALSRRSSRLCHTEAEVRVAVRQGAAEKRSARGFSLEYLHAPRTRARAHARQAVNPPLHTSSRARRPGGGAVSTVLDAFLDATTAPVGRSESYAE